MVETIKNIDGLIEVGYVPSSVERKKAVLMYFFVGIVVALSKNKISVYELFHLKQAMGRWVMFFILMVIGIVFVFIPRVWVIPLVVSFCFFVVWFFFIKQAREGRYLVKENKIFLPFFFGVGGRVIDIFELEIIGGNEG